jgi:hypothetical protein
MEKGVIFRMETRPNNPATNKLGPGLTETDVLDAVSKSGYPLQTIVGNYLRSQFHVQEEWSYIDKDAQELRTIDILAEKHLYDLTREHPRVRPTLDLLVECKQSALPYVFFLSSSKPWVPHFPLLAGLFRHTLILTTDDDASSYELHILHALELDSHPFIVKEPEYCMSFTKCVRKGNDVELSGSESFHGLVLPILKAMHYFQIAESPPKTAFYFDCHLVIGIGIIDAPMVGVRVSEQAHDLTLLPWVRVVRHEPDEFSDFGHWTRLSAIDIIHKDFLKDYLDKHVLPFAQEFSKLVIKHQQVLASGQAFATGMAKYGSHEIEQRLEPRRMSTRVSRSSTIGKNIIGFLTRRKSINE